MNEELKDVAITDIHLERLTEEERERYKLFVKMEIEQRKGVIIDFTREYSDQSINVNRDHFSYFTAIQKLFFEDYFLKMSQKEQDFEETNVCKVLCEMSVEFVRDDKYDDDADADEEDWENEFFNDASEMQKTALPF